MTDRCRCGHAPHRDGCKAKGPSKCTQLLDARTGEPSGSACSGTRQACPCPLGQCHTCGAPIAGASPLPLGDLEVDVDCGSAGAPDGTLAAWKLADGTLAVRLLDAGEAPGPGEWRGRPHAHQLADAAAWLARREAREAIR